MRGANKGDPSLAARIAAGRLQGHAKGVRPRRSPLLAAAGRPAVGLVETIIQSVPGDGWVAAAGRGVRMAGGPVSKPLTVGRAPIPCLLTKSRPEPPRPA